MGKKSAKRVKRAWAASRGGGNEKPSPVMALGGTCPQLPTPSDPCPVAMVRRSIKRVAGGADIIRIKFFWLLSPETLARPTRQRQPHRL